MIGQFAKKQIQYIFQLVTQNFFIGCFDFRCSHFIILLADINSYVWPIIIIHLTIFCTLTSYWFSFLTHTFITDDLHRTAGHHHNNSSATASIPCKTQPTTPFPEAAQQQQRIHSPQNSSHSAFQHSRRRTAIQASQQPFSHLAFTQQNSHLAFTQQQNSHSAFTQQQNSHSAFITFTHPS